MPHSTILEDAGIGNEPETVLNPEELMWDTKFLKAEEKPDVFLTKPDLKDKKLKEVFAKNRELNVMLEKERTHRVKLEIDFDKIKRQLENAANQAKEDGRPDTASSQ